MDTIGIFLLVASAAYSMWKSRQDKNGIRRLLTADSPVLEAELHGFPCRIRKTEGGRIALELRCPSIPLEFRAFQGERSFAIGEPDFDEVVTLDGEPGRMVAILGTEERIFVRAFVRIGGRLEAGSLRLEVRDMEEVERRLELMGRLATMLLAQQPEVPSRLLLWLEDPFHPHRVELFRTLFRHWPQHLSLEHWRRYLLSGEMEFRWEVASAAGPELQKELPEWGIAAWLPLAVMGRPELQETAFRLLCGHPEGWSSLHLAMEVAPAPALLELALRWKPNGPELEQLLVTALKATPSNPEWGESLQQAALRRLEVQGSVRVVESLLPLSRSPGPLGQRVAEVIRLIQGRSPGAMKGQLSLSDDGGGLSLADGGGELSPSGEHDQISDPGPQRLTPPP